MDKSGTKFPETAVTTASMAYLNELCSLHSYTAERKSKKNYEFS